MSKRTCQFPPLENHIQQVSSFKMGFWSRKKNLAKLLRWRNFHSSQVLLDSLLWRTMSSLLLPLCIWGDFISGSKQELVTCAKEWKTENKKRHHHRRPPKKFGVWFCVVYFHSCCTQAGSLFHKHMHHMPEETVKSSFKQESQEGRNETKQNEN